MSIAPTGECCRTSPHECGPRHESVSSIVRAPHRCANMQVRPQPCECRLTLLREWCPRTRGEQPRTCECRPIMLCECCPISTHMRPPARELISIARVPHCGASGAPTCEAVPRARERVPASMRAWQPRAHGHSLHTRVLPCADTRVRPPYEGVNPTVRVPHCGASGASTREAEPQARECTAVSMRAWQPRLRV